MSNLPTHPSKQPAKSSRKPESHLTGYQQKLRAAIAAKMGTETGQQGGQVPPGTCLLLDLSPSMSAVLKDGSMYVEKLAEIVDDLPKAPRFGFSGDCRELPLNTSIMDIWNDDVLGSGTFLGKAFRVVKAADYKNIVLITDGEPNDPGGERVALQAATGLHINIFYVGPEPVPQFLRDLAAQAGGSFGAYTFSQAPALTQAIRGLLAPPSSVPAKKEAIEL